MKWRIATLIGFFGILYSILIFNAFNIQVLKNDEFVHRAEAQQELSGALNPIRGNIYFVDKNGNTFPAALNKNFPTVYAVPVEIEDPQKSADLLAPIIGLDASEIERRIKKPDDKYELLIEKASDEEVTKIKELNLKGVYVKPQLLRYYPFGDIASHVLGFVSAEENSIYSGKYGIEKQFNELLSGKTGGVKGKQVVKSEDGKDVRLTIDHSIQAAVHETLDNLIKEKGATGGTVIVEDPKTGRILALENLPGFDPNDFSESEIKNFLNPAVQAVYEPGSVFKPVTMSAGIDSGKITPETSYVDTGSATVNGRTMRNWDNKAHGRLTMTEVIEQSINTGTIFAERQTGHGIFYDYLEKFGFDELTGITLPGEVQGNIKVLKKGQDVNYATASFGQGISVTPLAMIKAMAAIANDGVMMKPIILDGDKPQIVRRTISSDTAEKITRMMVSAVVKNKLAAISNYSVAGKTGTAFIPNFGGKGYSDDVINTYIGFAPATDPKFIILIKLDNPEGAPLAGTTVVPAFKSLAEFILNYYNIPPDNL